MFLRSITATLEERAVLSAAFDISWFEVNQPSPIDPLAAPAARENLRSISLGLWEADPSQDLLRAFIEQLSSQPDFILSAPADIAQPPDGIP